MISTVDVIQAHYYPFNSILYFLYYYLHEMHDKHYVQKSYFSITLLLIKMLLMNTSKFNQFL